MLRRVHWGALLFIIILSFGATASAVVNTGACFTCEERNRAGTIAADVCVLAGNGGEGFLMCSESTIGIFQYCDLSGSACYNTNVDAGGGGGSGGSGGGCVVGMGSA
jgi:hypothetical protein